MAFGDGGADAEGAVALAGVAAVAATGADADHVHGAVADVVVGVAGEVFGGEFPVAGYDPFLDAHEDFRAAFAAVTGVEGGVEVGLHVAEVVEEGGGGGVPVGPDGALVVDQLGDFNEAPLGLVELLAVGFLEIGDADKLAVGGVAPAVVGAGEDGGVALVVAADFHAAVHTSVEEDVDLALAVAGENHGFLAHGGDEIVAGVGYLAFVADEEPASGEDLLLFLLVEGVVDEDLAADGAMGEVDEVARGGGGTGADGHGGLLGRGL